MTPLDELRDLVKQGLAPDVYDLLPSYADLVARIVDRHGTLAAARDAIGEARRRRIETDADVATLLRELEARGVRLTPKDLRRLGEDAVVKEAYARFGSWTKARRVAGVATPARAQREVPARALVLDALRGRARPAGSLAAVDVDPQLAYAARRHFGSVARAIVAAEIPLRKPNERWTKSMLLDEIRARVARGVRVTHGALRSEGRMDLASAIHRRFGTMDRARSLASMPPASSKANGRRRRAPGRVVASRTLGDKKMKDVHTKVQELIGKFVADVTQIARQRALEALTETLGSGATGPARRGRRRSRRR